MCSGSLEHYGSTEVLRGVRMLVEYGGQQYQVARGSDVVRDGMFVELHEYIPSQSQLIDTSYWKAILYVFQSDVDGSVTFSCYREDVPFGLVEIFITEARRYLGMA